MSAELLTRELFRRLSRFAALQAADRWLLLQSLTTLAAARLALTLLPLGRVERAFRWRWHRQPKSVAPSVEKIVWAVQRTSEWVPGATCLVQAIAALHLLEGAGHEANLTIGTAKTETGQFTAHAWVNCGGRVVLGDFNDAAYTPILAWHREGIRAPRQYQIGVHE